MSPQPLRHRVLGALRLQPMTTEQVSRCLGVGYQTARKCLCALDEQRKVHRHGWQGRAIKFEVIA